MLDQTSGYNDCTSTLPSDLPRLRNASPSLLTMKQVKGNSKQVPLAIDAKGSLIELAHKLKWANRHFGQNSNSHDDYGSDVSERKNGGHKLGKILDPDHYVISGLYADGRPHPIQAYGQALFQKTSGEPCSYTSLGTVHSYNGSRNPHPNNGFVPFSTMSQNPKRTEDSNDADLNSDSEMMEVEDDQSLEASCQESMEESIRKLPESKHELMERFLNQNQEILSVKPTLNGVVGPSLWRYLTATKEIKDMDCDKIIESYQIEESEDDMIEAFDATEEKMEFHDESSQMSGDASKAPVDSRGNSIRDRMVVPLNELQAAAICSSAVDFVVMHKVPTRIVSQLYAMQASQRRQAELKRLAAEEPQAPCKPETPVQTQVGVCDRKYHCPNCEYQTDNKSHLRRHISSVHFIGMPYYCYICNKEFPRSEKVKAHFSKVHVDVEYDHRLVRKERFFGVDYSPEKTAAAEKQEKTSPIDPTREQPPSLSNLPVNTIKLTPKNMRTSTLAKSAAPVPSELISMAAAGATSNSLDSGVKPDAQGSVSSVGPTSKISPAASPLGKPVWRTAKSVAGEKRFYCPECPYSGKDIWHLKRHVNDVHQQKKDLKCPMCDYSTGRKHRLVSHMKNHGQLFCFHCDFSTDNIVIFQSHVKVCAMASRRAQHSCHRCNRPCTNRKQLQDHQFREHGVILFCCEKCMYYTENSDEFDQHTKQHQERQEDGYVCQVCNQVLTDYRSLRNHLASHRQTSAALQAQQRVSLSANKTPQGSATENNTSVSNTPKTSPVATPSSSQVVNEPEKAAKQNSSNHTMLSCPSCEFETPYMEVLQEHKVVHSEECLKCDAPGCIFSTVWPMSLEHHKKIQHLASASSLVKPLKIQPSAKPPGKGTFICPVCQDNRPPFRYKRSFEKHMAQHKEDEEKCPLCSRVFYFRVTLKQHLQDDHQARVIEVSSSSSSGESSEESGDESEAEVPEPTTNHQLQAGASAIKPMSQGAAMEAYGPGTVLHGSMAPQM